MSAHFSGEPVTRWISDPGDDDRVMLLEQPFSYTDPDDAPWPVPVGAWINGATIPKPLWSLVGSPYVGNYRRASIVHDYYVGEGNNPPVTPEQRRAADRMFYHACRTGGCSWLEAKKLYTGVRMGSWMALSGGGDQAIAAGPSEDRDTEEEILRGRFEQLVAQSDATVPEGDFEALERFLDDELPQLDANDSGG